MDCVGDSEAFHAVGVAPFLEMALESASAPVAVVTANLAFVFNAEPVQFVEPIGYGPNRIFLGEKSLLAIPAQG